MFHYASGHPFDCVLATSGIEDDVKLWTPTDVAPVNMAKVQQIVDNNMKMVLNFFVAVCTCCSIVHRPQMKERTTRSGIPLSLIRMLIQQVSLLSSAPVMIELTLA